ncbi:hypothetical protein [Prevotella sp. 10(H)]|uniref:hypothetical protein n=1 Tax=Prevotella sp. 10(H) TaxID=1158294 RepID=UPI0004A74193|nr:hypothetical protein [Prevotella sp. 10(H)]
MYSSEFCDVSYLSDSNVVFVEWKNFCKGNDYRQPLLYAIEVMRANKDCHYMADTRHGFENEEADTLWVFNEFIPLAATTGCKYIIFIIGENNNLKEELEGQSVELKKYFEVKAFFSIEEAKEFLKS